MLEIREEFCFQIFHNIVYWNYALLITIFWRTEVLFVNEFLNDLLKRFDKPGKICYKQVGNWYFCFEMCSVSFYIDRLRDSIRKFTEHIWQPVFRPVFRSNQTADVEMFIVISGEIRRTELMSLSCSECLRDQWMAAMRAEPITMTEIVTDDIVKMIFVRWFSFIYWLTAGSVIYYYRVKRCLPRLILLF